jgi:membrane protein implicated in regulation of membrane protease activity
MRKYWIILIALILVSGLAMYETLFFAWLGATPLSVGQYERARYDCHCWSAIFVVSALLTVSVIARMIWLRRKILR